MSGVVSCILPEDFLTMALSNPALQDLYFLFRHSVLITLWVYIWSNNTDVDDSALQFPKYYTPAHWNWHRWQCYGTSSSRIRHISADTFWKQSQRDRKRITAILQCREFSTATNCLNTNAPTRKKSLVSNRSVTPSPQRSETGHWGLFGVDKTGKSRK